MNKIKALYQKHKEIILYIIFGALTTLVNFVVYLLFDLILDKDLYLVTNLIAWVIAALFAYVVNKLFVFSVKSFDIKTVLRELLEFFGARVLSFLIEEAGMVLFIEALGFKNIAIDLSFFTVTGDLIAKVILAVIVIILNYFFSKFIIFKKKS
ncbi:MAG: GtrA family protein [Clostridia bacterium]|nr:GtrA family protein [Clostridia bacterium]